MSSTYHDKRGAKFKAYQPKGGMCGSCKDLLLDCSKHPFSAMPVIAHHGETAVVKCTYHEPIKSPS